MRLSPPLLSLAIGAFGIGTTEFVIMGLLPNVAADLGVSIPSAGLIVTAYAVGVVVGAPLLAILTARWARKASLVGLMALFAFGNLLCALAPTYGLLIAARILTAFAHAAFFGIGAVAAADLVPRHQRAQAMSLMFAGLTLANILGVPGGTAFGQLMGWRMSFAAVAVIGCAAVAGMGLFLPRGLPVQGGSVMREFPVMVKPQVLIGMAMSAVMAASLFAAFTYIAPMLQTVTGFAAGDVTFVLLVYGVGLTLGNVVGGRLADWKTLPSIIGLFVVLVGVQLAFAFAVESKVAAVAVMFVWGFVTFALVAPLQMRVVDSARGAPNLASTLNQGAFNVGNATGPTFGGLALSLGMPYQHLPYIGAALAALGLGLALAALALARKARPIELAADEEAVAAAG